MELILTRQNSNNRRAPIKDPVFLTRKYKRIWNGILGRPGFPLHFSVFWRIIICPQSLWAVWKSGSWNMPKPLCLGLSPHWHGFNIFCGITNVWNHFEIFYSITHIEIHVTSFLGISKNINLIRVILKWTLAGIGLSTAVTWVPLDVRLLH